MVATILITDSSDKSGLIRVYYRISNYTSWDSFSSPLTFGQEIDSGTAVCTPAGLSLFDKPWGLRLWFTLFRWTLFLEAGQSGSGSLKNTNGRLDEGDVNWLVLNVRRNGAWMDERLSESEFKIPSLREK